MHRNHGKHKQGYKIIALIVVNAIFVKSQS